MTVERFARREGQMFLLDLGRRAGADSGRRSGRLVFRERFRLFLRRQFPEWKLAELSAEAESRAQPLAGISRAPSCATASTAGPPSPARRRATRRAVLSFAPDLARLSSRARAAGRHRRPRDLRARGPRTLRRAAPSVPRPGCRALRAVHLRPRTKSSQRVDPQRSRQSRYTPRPCRRPEPNLPTAWSAIAALPGVERIPKHDGRVSLRVHGIEFAEIAGGELRFGLAERRPALPHHAGRDRAPRRGARASALATDEHPLYRQYPEAWLESQARAQIETLDARCSPIPSTARCPRSPGAIAAFSTCWPSTAPAGWS